MEDDLCIARGLENRAAFFQMLPPLPGIGEVPVVGDGDQTFIKADGQRLRIEQHRIARRRVAGVPDSQPAAQPLENLFGEDLRHLSHGLVVVKFLAVADHNPGALLSAMLLSVEPEIGQFRGLRMAVNGKDATLVVEFIVHARAPL